MKKSDSSHYPPPEYLSKGSKQLWRKLVPRRARSPERLELLRLALERRDRALQAREILAREGLTSKTKTTGALHVHPLVKVEREAWQQFVKIWVALHLNTDVNGGGQLEPFDAALLEPLR